MSEEKLEMLRPLLAEWSKGNFWTAPELLAPDVTFRAAMPANFVAHGLEETARHMLEVLEQWSDYRIEAEELDDLGKNSVLASGRQRGTGKISGAEADYPIFILFEFRANKVVAVYLEGTRDAALEAAGLSE